MNKHDFFFLSCYKSQIKTGRNQLIQSTGNSKSEKANAKKANFR